MPIGAQIAAAREGVVVAVEERYADGNGVNGHENYVDILHDDGSEGQYVHLTHNGALVAEGETVIRGQVIALSGNTGNSSAPHLHFHVLGSGVRSSIGVSFRNTRAHLRGLVVGEAYRAEPF